MPQLKDIADARATRKAYALGLHTHARELVLVVLLLHGGTCRGERCAPVRPPHAVHKQHCCGLCGTQYTVL